MDEPKKYLAENEVSKYLAKQHKFAAEEQRKHGRCDEQQDAYWQGWIDLISIMTDDFDINIRGE
jgi:hypothetical protein